MAASRPQVELILPLLGGTSWTPHHGGADLLGGASCCPGCGRVRVAGWFGKQSRTPTFYDDSIEKWAGMRSERVSLREMVSFGLRAQTQPRLALKSASFLLQVRDFQEKQSRAASVVREGR